MGRLWVVASMILIGTACGGTKNIHSAAAVPKTPPSQPLTEAEKKLDGPLLSLVRSQDPNVAAKSLQVEQRSAKIKIEIVTTSKDVVAAVKTHLQSLGAEDIVELENHIWAYVPASSVQPMTLSEQVWSMSVSRPTVSPQSK